MARRSLFERLPEVWRNLDLVENVVDEKGVLERYLDIWDNALNLCFTSTQGVLDTRDVRDIEDRFLVLIGGLAGHRWKSYRSYQWNRQRIRELISRYSYKGTAIAVRDLAYEYGATYCEIIDNASLVDVWNVQYGMFFDADFFHPGVYQLLVSDDIDLEHFLEDFEYLKAGGTKWYIKFLPSDTLAVTEYNAGGEPRFLTQNLFTEDRMWWWNYVPQPPEYPLVITKDTHAVMNASLFMGSLTLQFDEELVIWGDGILPAELNHKQPLIDIDVPT